MLPVFIIAFREFLEAFLSIGILLSMSIKFNLHRTKGIVGGAIVGFVVILILAIYVFSVDSTILKHLPKDFFNLIEGWLFLISSIFIAYAVFSLHTIMSVYSKEHIKNIHAKIERYKVSHWLLPFTAFLFVFKEGCEGIFFNVSNGVFYTFSQDLMGFGAAFLLALICGIILQKFLNLISLKRIFRITEVFIIFVGLDAMLEGADSLINYYFHINISPYNMLLALIYVILIYEVFIREDKKAT